MRTCSRACHVRGSLRQSLRCRRIQACRRFREPGKFCVDLYDELVRRRLEWHDPDDAGGRIKVVMTGSASDPAAWQPHFRNKPRREALAKRFRDSGDPFRIVLVRDMWLTGFDAPSLHTTYVDKPMRGHGLM